MRNQLDDFCELRNVCIERAPRSLFAGIDGNDDEMYMLSLSRFILVTMVYDGTDLTFHSNDQQKCPKYPKKETVALAIFRKNKYPPFAVNFIHSSKSNIVLLHSSLPFDIRSKLTDDLNKCKWRVRSFDVVTDVQRFYAQTNCSMCNLLVFHRKKLMHVPMTFTCVCRVESYGAFSSINVTMTRNNGQSTVTYGNVSICNNPDTLANTFNVSIGTRLIIAFRDITPESLLKPTILDVTDKDISDVTELLRSYEEVFDRRKGEHSAAYIDVNNRRNNETIIATPNVSNTEYSRVVLESTSNVYDRSERDAFAITENQAASSTIDNTVFVSTNATNVVSTGAIDSRATGVVNNTIPLAAITPNAISSETINNANDNMDIDYACNIANNRVNNDVATSFSFDSELFANAICDESSRRPTSVTCLNVATELTDCYVQLERDEVNRVIESLGKYNTDYFDYDMS